MLNHSPHRLLVVSIRAIGDVVLITPVIRQLRKAYPDLYLVVLADGPSADILQHNPHLNRVIGSDRHAAKQQSRLSQFVKWRQLVGEIRREQFDTVIDLFSGPRSALLAWLSRATHRYGEDVRSRIRGYLYNHSVPIARDARHLVDQKFDLVRPLIGDVNRQDLHLEVCLSSAENQKAHVLLSEVQLGAQKIVGLVPGAGSPWRIWPSERFAELADAIVNQYHAKVVLLGGEQDRPVCQRVREMMQQRPLDLSGQTSLRELIAVLAELDLVISNVTGPMHIASALSKPKVIGLYGAADTIQYAPWGQRATMLTKGQPEEAYWQNVDYQHDHRRLLEITVDDVLQMTSQVMEEWETELHEAQIKHVDS